MKFEFTPKRYWEDYGPNKGWNNEAMGKWAILKLSDDRLYWCYGDGGDPYDFSRGKGLFPEYEGFINTWSRDYHFYSCDRSFDQAEESLGSGNVWSFSSGDFDEYGTFLQGEGSRVVREAPERKTAERCHPVYKLVLSDTSGLHGIALLAKKTRHVASGQLAQTQYVFHAYIHQSRLLFIIQKKSER